MINTNPFKICPESISDRSKLRGILCDVFPTEKIKTNIILAAFDEGIAEAISKESNIDEKFIGRFSRLLVSDYGISESNAKLAIDYWISEYGLAVLGKKVISSTGNINQQAQNQVHQTNSTATNVKKTFNTIISVKSLKENDKLPNDLIMRHPDIEMKYGITDLKVTAKCGSFFRNYADLKIAGEYFGKTKQYILILVMVYNADNELIATYIDKHIPDKFNGRASFSMDVQIPNDEYISKVEVRLTPDPVWC